MTIDKQKLKSAALAISEGNALEGPDAHDAMIAFEDVATPSALLALLAEIERLEQESEDNRNEREIVCANYDQLKAENEALRKDAQRYRWLRVGSRPAAELDSVFNTYGLPVDEAIDAAMAKEANHG